MTPSIAPSVINGPFWIAPTLEPYLAADTASYLIAYKPPRIHTAPLQKEEDATLLAWVAALYPEVLCIKGRKENEGGLLHRLDYETQGLVLIAKTQHSLESLLEQQEKEMFIKEYDAVFCVNSDTVKPQPGFPAYTEIPLQENRIVSAFRAFGEGGKSVRPVLADTEKPVYCTEILSHSTVEDKELLHLRIARGFRHQIRCHLAWIGKPILNDALYGGGDAGDNSDGGNNGKYLALRASSLSFYDPDSGELKTYSI
jgi:23S rRNA pseudouridine1911/1915/1917 synthase